MEPSLGSAGWPRPEARRSGGSHRSHLARIALRRAEEERGDMPFVPERRRSRRIERAIRSERSEPWDRVR